MLGFGVHAPHVGMHGFTPSTPHMPSTRLVVRLCIEVFLGLWMASLVRLCKVCVCLNCTVVVGTNCDVCAFMCVSVGYAGSGARRASPTVTQCFLVLLQSNASCPCHWLLPVHAPIGSTTDNSSNAVPCVLSLVCVLVHEQPRARAPTVSVCCVHQCRRGCTLHTYMAMLCMCVTSCNCQFVSRGVA